MVLVVIVGFALVALIDLPSLVRRRKRRAVSAFAFVFVIGLALGICVALDIEVPSTLKVVSTLFERLGLSYPT